MAKEKNGNGDSTTAKASDQPKLIEEPKPTITKVTLGSDHERRVVRAAFDEEATRLEKMAKGIEDKYPKEARTIRGDAGLIRHELVTQVQTTQMHVREGLSLESALVRLVEPALRSTLPTKVDSGKWKREDVAAQSSTHLAKKLLEYIKHVALSAYNAGYQDRHNDPELIALRAIENYDKPDGT